MKTRHRVLVLVAALASMLAWAAPAQAHDRLVESVPAAGSVLATAPETITLRFGSELLDLEAVVIVRDQAGEVLLTATGQVDGALVTAPLQTVLDDGSYSVAWRVISGDGAPIQGTFAFQVGLAAQVAPAAQTAPTSPSAAPTTTENATSPPAPALVSGLPSWALGLAAVGAAGAAGATAMVLRRRPRANGLPSGAHPTRATDESNATNETSAAHETSQSDETDTSKETDAP